MLKRLDHVELIPSDFERSLDFYTTVLEGSLAQRYAVDVPGVSEIAYIKIGDSAVELIRAPGAQALAQTCLLYTSPSPRDKRQSRMPSSA